VARYGGEEFAVILPETPKQEALVVAERIRASIAEHLFYHDHGTSIGNITVTIGLASFPEDALEKTELIDRADKGLYQGKTSGKTVSALRNGAGRPEQAVEKHPSAALLSSLVIATNREVRLIPQDFVRLASECF